MELIIDDRKDKLNVSEELIEKIKDIMTCKKNTILQRIL